MEDGGILTLLNIVSWLAICITIGGSLMVLLWSLKQRKGKLSTGDVLSLSTLTIVSGLFFYPLIKGYSVGQIQCIIDAMFALALYCWIRGYESFAGVLVGCMCLIKPQYAFIVLWFGLRKKFNSLVASLAVAALGSLAAGLLFGWQEQFAYVRVLSFMSRHGESYFANQSVNGLLHRLLFEGTNLQWEPNTFAPFSVRVFAATLVSSLLLIVVALIRRGDGRNSGGPRDFLTAVLVATMASPIVWEHHYGIAFPIFAYLVATTEDLATLKWLAAAFVLLGTSWSPLNLFAHIPLLNVLQSLPFFGSLLLFLLLIKSPARTDYASFSIEEKRSV